MPAVTLTTFMDFVAATGTARLTRVREAKKRYEQDGFSPATDYWKPLRDRIDQCFAQGWDAAKLKKSLAAVSDTKKIANYEEARAGLTKWVGKKKVTTLPPVKKKTWSAGGLSVGLTPLLHMGIDGDPHLIKLYFKAEPLSKQKVNVVLRLLDKNAPAGTTVGILDVRRSRLYTPTVPIKGIDALLAAEAGAFAAMWASL
jgi:hypothetical protein